MAMEDAVCLGACADAADGDFPASFLEYQKMRLVRASRVQISAGLLGLIFHAADGVPRLVRNDMYRQRSAADWHDALDWVFSAPDYVRNFAKKKRRVIAPIRRRSAPVRSPQRSARRKAS
jgi:3-hydroxybenzoate 6-monooxygenase